MRDELKHCESHELKCIFKHPEINSKTIKEFPKNCRSVCGFLKITDKSDVTYSQLKKAFKSMLEIRGSLTIVNTNFTDIRFLSIDPIFDILNFECYGDGIVISNNSFLTADNVIRDFYIFPGTNINECHFRIENNEQFDGRFICDFYPDPVVNMTVRNNLKDCTDKYPPTTTVAATTVDSKVILNGLNISDSSFYTFGLEMYEVIDGTIEIQNTKYEDLSFLRKLTMITVQNMTSSEMCNINIHDNKDMKRLNFPVLEDIVNTEMGPITINLENMHPDFCLTLDEIIMFMEQNVSFRKIDATLCEPITTVDPRKRCTFYNLTSLESGCQIIFGDILITYEDETFVEKLTEVEFLFGTLKIENATLEIMNYLYNLKYIVNLKESQYIIQYVSNKNLVAAPLPNLDNIVTRSQTKTVFIQSNPNYADSVLPRAMNGPADCSMMMGTTFRTTVNYVGENCVEENSGIVARYMIPVICVLLACSLELFAPSL
ncbi:hypothetical protein GCK72_020673 [Caenorhabditis remanei]|uniref:Receptor L-domain domain-containing protein n=1 Tax=Caenorhabditis remanei TaxID=31234 RepID=A0A6A5GHS6_CAERE|nr:hypothetical protein GCK72_020673 [Caenorhabditis remanei]KAF1754115.1 hypothetical protein GCK72_020673 [Caenorhabditis remanei]